MAEHDGSRTWKIKLLTPLHIGDGAELQLNMDYLKTDMGLGVIDLEGLFESMSENRSAISDFGCSSFDLSQFHKDYKIPIAPQYILPFKQKFVPRNIRSFIKTGFGKPYIPGSTLKGGVRTALWTQLDRSSLPSAVNYESFKKAASGIDGKDPHHDFLRPFQVSDSHGIEANGALQVEEVKFFNIMHGNKPGWKDFLNKKTTADFNKSTGIYVETLPSEQMFYVKAGIDQLFQKRSIKMASKLPDCPAIHDFKSFALAVNRHSLKIATQEESFFSQYEGMISGAKAFYTNLCSRITDISREPEAFIVRIAWGSGWRGMTGNWIEDKELEAVRRKNKLGKNGCPFCGSAKVKWNPSQKKLECKNKSCGKFFSDEDRWFHEIFPKTRRLVMLNGVPCLPLGWVLVTSEEKASFYRMPTEMLKPGDGPELLERDKLKKAENPVPAADPVKLMAEKKENFEKRLSGVKNLTGEIDPFLAILRAEKGEEIQKELCSILLKAVKKLPKDKYGKALKNQKKWAISLDSLGKKLRVVV